MFEEKVLLVDDEPNILGACQRVLRETVRLEVAQGGEEGLRKIAAEGPFALVIADMRMPGMDGVQFLSKVRQISPETVRMMLTGNADLQTAVDAVNEGHIFRFLTKPCQKEVLAGSVQAGIEQHRLIIAERQLLEETLNGSITVLMDVLSLVNPTAFGRSARIRRYIRHLAAELGLPNTWKFEVAAMLSQNGFVTLPAETLQKIYAGQELSAEEKEMYSSHPDIGARLIVHIPRLEDVAHMIARQQEPCAWNRPSDESQRSDEAALGGRMLKVALAFDQLVSHGVDPDSALAQLRRQPDVYDLEMVSALEGFPVRPAECHPKALPVHQLDPHMILDQDVHARSGNLLLTRGQELTFPVLERLRRWAKGVGVEEPVRVLVPRYQSKDEPAEVGATGRQAP